MLVEVKMFINNECVKCKLSKIEFGKFVGFFFVEM